MFGGNKKTRILNIMIKTIKTCAIVLAIGFIHYSYATGYLPESGDFLFQDLNCGSMCDGIDSVTRGYHNTYVSHVGMIINTNPPEVIEAVSKGVVITPLAKFLQRSLDQESKPRVMVGRLKLAYRKMIPNTIAIARKQIGKPYNSSFIPANGKAFYCSELFDYSFREVNNNQPFFHSAPMNFTNGKSSKILPLWQNYYKPLHINAPQGLPGTNPGAMSRESMIEIIYFYGQLRQH